MFRVWLEGATTVNNQITIVITHTGNEEMVSRDNTPFSFRHNSKTLNFIYNLNDKKIFEDANIGCGDSNNDALVGPFTWWHIAINANDDNKNLNLSNLTKVTLEFLGTNYAFYA